ncbi:RecQ family ATP-dependent DNA helicase [Sporobolomyces salmoneus]|uniref:RecQ family ATP-dependent DNA helicase n=1 Tax=Sporobolomyces salmoneus TaxID=183962 RepID=UPI003174E070
MVGLRPAGSTSTTRPNGSKPPQVGLNQQQPSNSTSSSSTTGKRVGVEGVPGSVMGESIKLGGSVSATSKLDPRVKLFNPVTMTGGRRSPLSSTTNHQPNHSHSRSSTTLTPSSSTQTQRDVKPDLSLVVKEEEEGGFVASNFFNKKSTSTSTSISTPKGIPSTSTTMVPMKRPSPSMGNAKSSSMKGKGKGKAIQEEEEEEEEIDELESDTEHQRAASPGDEEEDEEEDNFPSPNQQQQRRQEKEKGGGGRKKKKVRVSGGTNDSGFTEGDADGDKENDPAAVIVKEEEQQEMEGIEIPKSENGEGELLERLVLEDKGEGGSGDTTMNDAGGVEEEVERMGTRNGIGDQDVELQQEIAQVEGDLLALTNRRIALLRAFVEIAENGGGRSKDGLDENELRHTQSHVNERYDEARGRLEALGIAPTEFQLCKEKQAGCFEELYEVLQAPEGSLSSNGNDRGLIEHTLSYLATRIPKLEAAVATQPKQSRPVSRPGIPRIATLASGPLPSVHGSPSAVPGSRSSTHLGSVASPSIANGGGSRGGGGGGSVRSMIQPPPAAQHQQQPRSKKASSVTSGTESQNSATIAARKLRQNGTGTPATRPVSASTTTTTTMRQKKNVATPSHTSEQITLDSSSSERDPLPSPRSKRPPPNANSSSTVKSGFRAAGTAIQPQQQQQRRPPAAAAAQPPRVEPSASAGSTGSKSGRVEVTPEIQALTNDMVWGEDEDDVDDQEEEDEVPPVVPQRRTNQASRNEAFSITLEDPPPQRQQQQSNPAHQPLAQLQDHRRVPTAGVGAVGPSNRTVSSASDVIITSSTSASTSKALAPPPSTAAAPPPKNYPWTSDVNKALRQRFGLTKFRANQEAAINATLSGRDVFVLLPTGGGKSLCFQLPAVVSSGTTKGVTIVVSPLLSLISDQTKSLIEKDIPVVFLNSTMPAADKKFAMECLKADPPQTCLAYVTPEQIVNSGQFRSILADLHRRGQLARFVLDEAHCISSWGHDFRPDYKQMGSLKRDFPRIPLIALTATANSRVKTDVMTNLAMENPVVLSQSFNRANLRYYVKDKTKGLIQDIAEFIKTNHRGECGIIYCSSKKQCEDTAAKLRGDFKIPAQHYHAGMDKNDRIRVQENWQAGKVHVICATIAFGMGIDKADVRFVIHHSLSQSLEAYYQETGRAGRDGMNSVCVLYYNYADTKLLMRLIDEGDGTYEQKEHNRANLRRVVQFCMNKTDCRRSQVLGYFGEQFPKEQCHKTCDNCMSPKDVVMMDVGELASAAVRLVSAIERDKGVTMLYAIDVFRGSKIAKIVSNGHDQLADAGAGANIDRGDCERLFQLLFSEQILGERYERNGLGFTNAYIVLGPRSRQFLNGRIPLQMGFVGKEKGKKGKAKVTKSVNESYDHEVYEGEYVDELYDEVTGIYEEDPDGDWDDWGRRVIRTKSAEASGAGGKVAPPASKNNASDGLLAQLFHLRDVTAEEKGVDPSEVVSDSALQLIAKHCPRSVTEFLGIKELNPTDVGWWSDHGGQALCASMPTSNNSTSNAAAKSTVAPPPPPPPAPVASRSRAPSSTAGRRTSAANNAAKAAEARSAVAPSKAAPRKAPASRSTASKPNPAAPKQTQLDQFRYKAQGNKSGGGGVMAMPLPKKR